MNKKIVSLTMASILFFSICACENLPSADLLSEKDVTVTHASLPADNLATTGDVQNNASENGEKDSDQNADPSIPNYYDDDHAKILIPADYEDKFNLSPEELGVGKAEYKEYSSDELLKASDAYFEYMKNLEETQGKVRFSFLHVDNDNLAELIYTFVPESLYDFQIRYICTYDFESESVKQIAEFDMDGIPLYYKEHENVFWYTTWRDAGAVTRYCYFTLEDGNLVMLQDFVIGYDDEDLYMINGVSVDYKTYDSQAVKWGNNTEYTELTLWDDNAMIPLNGDYDYSYFMFNKDKHDSAFLDEVLNLYTDYFSRHEIGRYAFINIDGDDIPEMVFAEGDFHASSVSVLKADCYETEDGKFEGKISHVGSWGEYGTMFFSERNNLILGYYMGMGYEYESYSSLAYQEPVVLQVYENNAGTGEDNIYYSMNGCVVSQDIYNQYLNKWGNSYGRFNSIAYEDMYAEKDPDTIRKAFYEAVK